MTGLGELGFGKIATRILHAALTYTSLKLCGALTSGYLVACLAPTQPMASEIAPVIIQGGRAGFHYSP